MTRKSPQQLRRELEHARQRADRAESDGEYEAHRQVIIWLEELLAEAEQADRRAA